MNNLFISLVQELENYVRQFNIIKKNNRANLKPQHIHQYKQIRETLILMKKAEKSEHLNLSPHPVANPKPNTVLGDDFIKLLNESILLINQIAYEQYHIFFPASSLQTNKHLLLFQDLMKELSRLEGLLTEAFTLEKKRMHEELEASLKKYGKGSDAYIDRKSELDYRLGGYNENLKENKKDYIKYSKLIARQLIAQEKIEKSFSYNDSGDLILDLGKPSLPSELSQLTYKIFDLPLFEGNENDLCSIDSNDVQQTYKGNCTLLAALMQIAAKEPQFIKNAITPKGQSKNSTQQIISNYAVTLYLPQKETTGKKVQVLVSNEFYSKEDGEPHFLNKGDNEIWVLLIEKAVASLLGGYSIFGKDGYAINTILSVLTGQASPEISLTNGDINEQELQNWFIENKNKIITIGDSAHAYSVTSVDIDEDKNTIILAITDPVSLKVNYHHVDSYLMKNFARVASCPLTAGVECPTDLQNSIEKPIKTINSFLKMSTVNQLSLLQEKHIQWKNSDGDICIVKNIEDTIVTLVINGIEKDISIHKLILKPIIPLDKLEVILQKSMATWVDIDDIEYRFSYSSNGLMIFDSSEGESVELSIEAVYQTFGILKK